MGRRTWLVAVIMALATVRMAWAQDAAAPADTESRIAALEKEVADLKAEKEKSPDLLSASNFRMYWKDGLYFDLPDQKVTMRFGGRIQNDWAFFSSGEDVEKVAGSMDDGVEFRRARLFVSGDLFTNYEFKAEYDFAGGATAVKEVYLGVKDLPYCLGNVRAGHFKEPFSLEEMTSDNFTAFMERSSRSVFDPEYNVGFTNFQPLFDKRMTYAVGFFRPTDDFGYGQADGNYAGTVRVTGLPVYENDGQQLVHLGAAYSYRTYDGGVRVRQRPESHLAPRFVDTGTFDADSADLFGAELAAAYGPVWASAEYTWADFQGNQDPLFTGWYAQAGWFITGETRPYSPSAGTWDRVRPKQMFLGDDHGPGAWEVALRYSNLNLNDGAINGGRLQDVTTGLNWYLNSNFKVMWDYVLAVLDRKTSDNDVANIFEMRLQVDF